MKIIRTSVCAGILPVLLMAEAATQSEITSSQAVVIAASGVCGFPKSDPKGWTARLEGSFWRVWTPAQPDPDALSNFVFEQVYIDAETGKVDHCTERAE